MNRTLRIALLLDLLALSPLACGGSHSHAGAAAGPNAPPAGCQRTFCDFQADICRARPSLSAGQCSQCWSMCASDPSVDIDCASVCDSICSQPSDPSPPDPCAGALQACRQTTQNTLCVDHLGDPDSSGIPCNAEISAASCACGDDAVCGEALYAANPACETCDSGWQQACVNKACPAELSQLLTCLQQVGCQDTSCQSLCVTFVHALNACLNTAVAQPSDPGGCYSGSHACWVNPVCP